MAYKLFSLFFCIIVLALYTGCSSSDSDSDDIELITESRDSSEIKEEVKQPVTEIKEDIKPNDNKFSEKLSVTKSFSIQIGAFNDRENAEKFLELSRNKVTGMDLSIKDNGGYFKVTIGSFNTKQDAINSLDKAIDAGFRDSFVIEVSTVRQEIK